MQQSKGGLSFLEIAVFFPPAHQAFKPCSLSPWPPLTPYSEWTAFKCMSKIQLYADGANLL